MTLDSGLLANALFDLIVSNVCHQRGNRDAAALLDAGAALHTATLNGDEVGLSSLEILSAATEVADRFDLRRHGIEDYLLRRRSAVQWAELINDFIDEQTAFTFFSSGSTGEPTPTVHPLRHLQQEAAALATKLEGVERVRLFVPPRHIYGFIWGVVYPSIAGVPVLSAASSPAPLASGDLVVSYPDHWAFLASSRAPLPPGVQGLCSTAPLSADVARALHDRGLARLIEIYGSSQTAGVGWRDEFAGPYQLFDHWHALADEGGAAGEVITLTRDDSSAAEVQDLLIPVDSRRFRVAGRLDRAVQVSGMNVYPERVRSVLESCEHVATARVRLDAASGGLAALVVPVESTGWNDERRARLEQQLGDLCRRTLESFECPQRFTFEAAIPVGEMGKEARWA